MKDQIKNFIVKTFMFGQGTLKDDESLFEAGIIDSFGLLELLAFIEKTFKVSVDMSEITMDKFETVDKIVELIKQKQK